MTTLHRRDAIAIGAAAMAAPLTAAGTGPARAAAPMMGPARGAFYRFRLGAFEVTTLLDGAISLPGPHPIFGENQSAQAVAEAAEAAFLPADRMRIGFTPILVNTGSELVLFDTGNGPGRREGTGLLVEALADAGYARDAIDVVVLTHFHGDHIGGLAQDGVPTFPNARIVTHANEYAFWSADERLSGPTEGTARLTQANVVPLVERIGFIKDGDTPASGITVVEALGHTPGHCAYHIESEGRRLLLWADAANHYALSVGKPDWHVRFDMDKDAAVATRRALLEMAAADRIPVTGYHMPGNALGFVEATADSFRWVQASYQLEL